MRRDIFQAIADPTRRAIIGSLRTYWRRLKNRKRKNKVKMDFIVDKQKKTVYITKEFAAELSLVWDAYTRAELLDQW
jgi:hypothetical protein